MAANKPKICIQEIFSPENGHSGDMLASNFACFCFEVEETLHITHGTLIKDYCGY